MLFTQCSRGEMQGNLADNEFADVRKEYYKILEDADEKVQLANLMYDLVDRYLRRLDSELFKFKCELEADHNGITEILEKRSLELDGGTTTPLINATTSAGPGNGSQKENRFFGAVTTNNNHSQSRDRYNRSRPEKRRNSSSGSNAPPEKRLALTNNVPVPTPPLSVPLPSPAIVLPPIVPALQSTIGYTIPHLNNSNSIPSPSTPTMATTKHIHPGRRNAATLNSSFDSVHSSAGGAPHDLLVGRELGGPSLPGPLTPGVERDANIFNSQRRHKK